MGVSYGRGTDQSAEARDSRGLFEDHSYLTESIYKVVLQKSIPAQIRQLILYISNNQG